VTLRFLALGDSYTIGEGVEPKDRWPVQLAERIRGDGIAIADPVIVAQTGWTTDELAAAIDRTRLSGPFGLVSLLIGVNDHYQGRTAEQYRAGLRPLVEQSLGFTRGDSGHVVVLSIPDWSVTPFALQDPRGMETIAREIDHFNAVCRAEAHERATLYIDVTASSRRARDNRSLLAADGLHPSAAMYAEWAALVSSVLPPLRHSTF
jgi:lysophospholipase L1-like esterase